MKKYLIVGLGNIGTEYDATRHNIGFDVADVLVIKNGGAFRNDRLANVSEINFRGKKLIVIKPTTYMNLSGKAVKYWMDKEKIGVENLLVIVDDLALPIEELRLKASGSAAGHNGLKDIETCIGTQQYTRLRFGIGNDYPKGMQVNFVVGKWNKEELPLVKEKILRAVEIIESVVLIGVERSMNQFNKHSKNK